ncbi:MAG: bifunctional phosphopantothenoylcysteine decarboxylase/phosphopantothenate--cysteine ligase CoaBC [Chloroflexi bacterium]|nr:bifunctional phosphopantothenoylcysteine decarboxylase/phosphopantothenate--cysteine ligase CoaBC [Chloroflexota bacterium]MBT7082420.1 bifunctional phosphopantothenoylcysteine decarboxylase/phosphopantothenate--cysteine ligase CoaBC [Chloroflexota bacterium]
MLKGKNIILGVTGSISVYKAVDFASKLVQAGAVVDVVMTKAATEFVKPISFSSLTQRPVSTEMFPDKIDYDIAHISLSDRADLIVICPATANTIAKLANGIADDMLSSTVLATEAPVIIAPAMNYRMYRNEVTQQNIDKLKGRGFTFIGPATGRLASGAVGKGRLVDIKDVMGAAKQVLGRGGDLAGKKVVVTAGGTQEPIDPVRRVSNRSSGKMGYAIAEAARDRGASVVLVSAPTSLSAPYGVELVSIQTASQMHDAVVKAVDGCDVLIMAAAVADYRPKNIADSKIKKSADSLSIEMEKTTDILSDVSASVKIGFAAESDDLESNAQQKLAKKNLDFIVANDITTAGSGFDVDTNEVIIIDKSGQKTKLPLMPKIDVAHKILDRVAALVSKPTT